MFPHEAQELMAKILFFVFATCVLCLSKVRAEEVVNPSIELNSSTEISRPILK